MSGDLLSFFEADLILKYNKYPRLMQPAKFVFQGMLKITFCEVPFKDGYPYESFNISYPYMSHEIAGKSAQGIFLHPHI